MRKCLLIPLVILLLSVFDGKAQTALEFDGVDDYVQTDFIGVQGTTPRTFMAWIYLSGLPTGNLCISDYGMNAVGSRNTFIVNSNGYLAYLSGGTNANMSATVSTVPVGIWVHVAFVFDGTDGYLYQNGVEVGNGVLTAVNTPSGGTNLKIGQRVSGGNIPFKGQIDEYSIWDVALTPDQIVEYVCIGDPSQYDNIVAYYDFNDGSGSILTDLVGGFDGTLMNMDDDDWVESDVCDPGYQVISFPPISYHLITDPPFEVEATATSGLEVFFEIISGPATIEGNIITLTGEIGEVVIEATQPGDDEFDPAEPVQNSFLVIDPYAYQPDVDPRNPLEGDVYVPTLGLVQLASFVSIDYPELLSVQSANYEINGEIVEGINQYNGRFIGWWTPPDYGEYTVNFTATSNFGATVTESVNINVVPSATEIEVVAVDSVYLRSGHTSEVVEAELPSYLGAFDQITGVLELECPDGGCGAWDRVAHVYATDHRGQKIEIIRYVTPYGVACSHEIDLTDYMSFLQGKIEFEVECTTYDNGYNWYLTLNYHAGTPEHLYSVVDPVWQGVYPFGDYENLQPVEEVYMSFPDQAVASKLKLVSTGHAWGDNNTSNAAEFYEATHDVIVNGNATFEQYNWYQCNPNPDGCQPQSGTWYHNRAGWCPGAIAQWFDYDLTPYMGSGDIELGYEFYTGYVDLCHPHHPDCVTGVTCDDCDDTYNPNLAVAGNLVSFSEAPIITAMEEPVNNFYSKLAPNPADVFTSLTIFGPSSADLKTVEICTIDGQIVKTFDTYDKTIMINTTSFNSGIYILKVSIDGKTETSKLLVR